MFFLIGFNQQWWLNGDLRMTYLFSGEIHGVSSAPWLGKSSNIGPFSGDLLGYHGIQKPRKTHGKIHRPNIFPHRHCIIPNICCFCPLLNHNGLWGAFNFLRGKGWVGISWDIEWGYCSWDWFKGNQSIDIMNRTNWHDMIVLGKTHWFCDLLRANPRKIEKTILLQLWSIVTNYVSICLVAICYMEIQNRYNRWKHGNDRGNLTETSWNLETASFWDPFNAWETWMESLRRTTSGAQQTRGLT